MKAEDKLKEIRGRLTKSFPELTFCGGAYTLKMLDNDLKDLDRLIKKGS